MNLHEYQAKHLFAHYGMPVPISEVVRSAEEAKDVAIKLGGKTLVVKAQIHAGGRGKAGGVRLVASEEELCQAVKDLIGTRLVTYQTDSQGLPVHQVLIEEPSLIARELYLGAVIDRSKRRLVIMASTEGGVEIEHVAETSPEKILKIVVDPLVGIFAVSMSRTRFWLKIKTRTN